jgi:hypothetical protein
MCQLQLTRNSPAERYALSGSQYLLVIISCSNKYRLLYRYGTKFRVKVNQASIFQVPTVLLHRHPKGRFATTIHLPVMLIHHQDSSRSMIHLHPAFLDEFSGEARPRRGQNNSWLRMRFHCKNWHEAKLEPGGEKSSDGILDGPH